MPSITVGDDDSTVGQVGKDDVIAAAAEEQEKASPKELMCVCCLRPIYSRVCVPPTVLNVQYPKILAQSVRMSEEKYPT